jgi:hypothetical protein
MKDSSNQPFMVKVRVNRASPRWQSFYMPSVSQTVAVGGYFIGRKQDTNGLLIIDLTCIAYGVLPVHQPSSLLCRTLRQRQVDRDGRNSGALQNVSTKMKTMAMKKMIMR